MKDPTEQVGWLSSRLLRITGEVTDKEFVGFFWDDLSETWVAFTVLHDNPGQSRLFEHLRQIGSIPFVAGCRGNTSSIPLSTDSTETDSGKNSVYRGPNGHRFTINKRGTVW